ncbi:hypothetical protein EMIHUDRAFT_214559 [Emiliania huxleyi CCMP1516]|uniref:Uncharacterized protein n=2 Tax=Emiliania huxleyi TaxID=2903 RepID=A0A0D3IK83_EMIH1|nr:hypothetical protein EMIHUDRAFT_214559 [Emiliania huxleyi CCMP1516]EOD11668.1 hypothetical protein EMIHUDRAFT_214559 [Emiliania huxleyi CCMP1516]|eukprot:XP_005764097.1 hypothetical protein EMIHUDRAFT_214559 [Emiliania huxleyi CCMP1516]
MLAVVAVSGGCAAAPERRVTRASFGKVLRTLSTDSLRQGGAGAGWLGSSAGGLRPGYLVLLKLLQETPMTMALSSRLTSVRARWRAARDSTDSLPAQRAHSNAPAAPADCWTATVAKCGRRPPLLPSAFAAELETKSFTNGKDDKPLEQFGKATRLDYVQLGWGDAEAAQLAEMLGVDNTEQPELVAVCEERGIKL